MRSKRKKRHKSTRQIIETSSASSVFFFFDVEYKAKRKNGFSRVFDQLLICIFLYSIDWIGHEQESEVVNGAFMNNKNQFVTIWMFAGMLLGLVIGCVIGISQGKLGISMCYGLVLGMMVGLGAGTAIKKIRDRK